jgi:hypothetical protein
LQPGEVVVSGVGGMTNVAVWGELFSNAAKARGARGFLTDGCHRDTRMVLDLGFPVFSRGPRPVDISGRGTVISIGRPVEVAGVVVHPGDVVFARSTGSSSSHRMSPKRRCRARSKKWPRRTERAKICARDASCRKSGPSIASSSMGTEQPVACWSKSRPPMLSSGLNLVQTYAYRDNVSILEAPIAPEPSGRISR